MSLNRYLRIVQVEYSKREAARNTQLDIRARKRAEVWQSSDSEEKRRAEYSEELCLNELGGKFERTLASDFRAATCFALLIAGACRRLGHTG